MSSSSCLKIAQNLLGALYTLVYLTHFSCIISVTLYNGANFISLLSCVYIGVLTMFPMVWLRKKWLMVKFFSPNIIIGKIIGISMWELNKVHDMGIQSLGDKENKKVV